METGLHGADWGVGDAGDFFEREIFEDVKEEDGALERWKFFDEGEESVGVFAAEELRERIVGGRIGDVGERV